MDEPPQLHRRRRRACRRPGARADAEGVPPLRPGSARCGLRPPAGRPVQLLVAAVATLLELLRAEGHEVRGVYSGRAVLDMVCDFGPDVVLLDIGMPLVSGY